MLFGRTLHQLYQREKLEHGTMLHSETLDSHAFEHDSLHGEKLKQVKLH